MEEKQPVQLNEAEVEVETPSVSVSEEVVEDDDKIATKADIERVIASLDKTRDAIQELTKMLGENIKENQKWFRAGKM